MADLHPESKLEPQALVIQLDPATSKVVELALRFCIVLPSGQELHEIDHWWKEATDAERALAQGLADAAIAAAASTRSVTHAPAPPEVLETEAGSA